MALVALGVVAACSSTALPPSPLPPKQPLAPPPPVLMAEGGCDADAAQFALGQTASAALIEQARLRVKARTVRFLRPGQMVTLEFNAERLNLNLDSADRVVRVDCG